MSAIVDSRPTPAALRGFSTPFEPFDEDLLATIALEYARAGLDVFLERAAEHVEEVSEGLVPALESAELDFETVWNTSFGHLVPAVAWGGRETRRRDAAGAGLRLAWAGQSARWSIDLADAAPFRFGRWVIPGGRRIEVDAAGDRVDVVADGTQVRFVREDGEWAAEGAERLTVVRGIVLIDGRGVVPGDFDREPIVERVPPEFIAALEAGLDLLAAHAPGHVRWVHRVLRELIVTVHEPGRVSSGSSSGNTALAHMSALPNPIAVAETLVHECAHLHYNAVTRIEPVDDGSDERTYYSPAVRMERSIERILLAYHAFANILALYRVFDEAGVEHDGYLGRHLPRLTHEIEQLEAPLRGNPALTSVGRALAEPLMERLRLESHAGAG